MMQTHLNSESSTTASLPWRLLVIVAMVAFLAAHSSFAQSSKPLRAGKGPSALGPKVDRVVNVNSRDNAYLDLDTGRIFSRPDKASEEEGEIAWRRHNAIDVAFSATTRRGKKGVLLMGCDLISGPVDGGIWQGSPRSIVTEVTKAEWHGRGAAHFTQTPSSFVFRTREGGVGLLRLLRTEKSAGGYTRRIVVEYALLKNPPSVGDEDVVWGDAVGGIRCAVRPPKAVHAPGESLQFEVTYRNVSDRPITVCVYADVFYTWTGLRVRPLDPGNPGRMGRHGTGPRFPLKRSDFVTLGPGGAAGVSQAIPAEPILKPGRYMVKVELNSINQMEKHILGYKEFCEAHGLQPWSGVIESGIGRFRVLAPSFAQTAEWVRSALQSGMSDRNSILVLEFTAGKPLRSPDDLLQWWWSVPVAGPPPGATFKPDPPASLWKTLADPVGRKPAAAMVSLAAGGKATLTLLEGKLHPVTADAARLGELIANLDSDKFAVRDAATRELSLLGRAAKAALEAAMGAGMSAEATGRAEGFLEACTRDYPTMPESRRFIRAIRVLEKMGSARATKILRKLATGSAKASVTLRARAALQRLENAHSDSASPASHPTSVKAESGSG
jgi:hypothetical protein